MNLLLDWDIRLFELLNGQWHNTFLDWCMPWWREKLTWVPAYILLLGVVVYKMRTQALVFILAAILSVGLADTVSSKVLKPLVKRDRPCNNPERQEALRLLTGCGKAYSFTSSHAANHFALATFLSLALGMGGKFFRWGLFFWAGTIAYGQVYVGVHYPLDVLCGGLLGWIIGNIVAKTYLRVLKRGFIKSHIALPGEK